PLGALGRRTPGPRERAHHPAARTERPADALPAPRCAIGALVRLRAGRPLQHLGTPGSGRRPRARNASHLPVELARLARRLRDPGPGGGGSGLAGNRGVGSGRLEAGAPGLLAGGLVPLLPGDRGAFSLLGGAPSPRQAALGRAAPSAAGRGRAVAARRRSLDVGQAAAYAGRSRYSLAHSSKLSSAQRCRDRSRWPPSSSATRSSTAWRRKKPRSRARCDVKTSTSTSLSGPRNQIPTGGLKPSFPRLRTDAGSRSRTASRSKALVRSRGILRLAGSE